MCELKQLGATGGLLLCWSTYITLTNTQQSFMHVWGHKKTERENHPQYNLPRQPPSTITIWNTSAAFCSKYVSLVITPYQWWWTVVDWAFQMRSLAGVRATGWWFLKVPRPWEQLGKPGQRQDWPPSPGVTRGGEGHGQTKGQEDGVGWHCREEEAAVTIQSFFRGENIWSEPIIMAFQKSQKLPEPPWWVTM